MDNQVTPLFLGILAIVVSVGLVEAAVRYGILKPDISRRLAHIISGCYALSMYFFLHPATYVTLCVGFTILIALSYVFKLLTAVHNVSRHTYGEILLPLGFLSLYIFSNADSSIFIAGLLVTTFADPLCGIVSDIRKLKRQSKLGSITFFTATFLILLFATNHAIFSVVAMSATLTVVERISGFGSDNLTVPVATVLLLGA